MILCDIGNTTFAFLNTKKKQKFKISIDVKRDKLPIIKDKIYFISVNQKATDKLLKKYPNSIDCKELFNFKTSYQGLGIDRQVACKAIRNGIIVDVGSAITIDIMKNGKHKGGFILSGIKRLISFYPQISPKLNFNFKSKVDLSKLPTNTNDAISYAILKSILLPIKECEQNHKLPIYFTGEDSVYLIKYFPNSSYKKNLIFNSMKKIIKEKRNN